MHINFRVSIADLGAVSDGHAMNTAVIQQAIDMCHEAGGGQVFIPAGTFLSASLQLRSKVDLHLSPGAILKASSNYADYSRHHDMDVLSGGAVDEYVLPKRSFISGFQAHQCSISGLGTIDGSGLGFVEVFGPPMHHMRAPQGAKSQYLERPYTIFLTESHNLNFRDFTIIDPAFWAFRLTGCDNVLIDAINIHTDLMVPNADGIDIDRCARVRISNCDLVTADDCISLKANSGAAQYGPVEDVVISNCTMTTASGAITLGCDSGDIKNVTISNCIVRDSNRGIAIRPREGGIVENVIVSNCVIETRQYEGGWWGHGEPLHVTAFRWEGDDVPDEQRGNPERQLPGKVRNILIKDVMCHSGSGAIIWGEHSDYISNVVLDNITFFLGNDEPPATTLDLRPCPEPQLVEREPAVVEVVNATDVMIRQCRTVWGEHSQRYAHGISTDNAPGLQVLNSHLM